MTIDPLTPACKLEVTCVTSVGGRPLLVTPRDSALEDKSLVQIINFNLDLVSLGQMNQDIAAAAKSGQVVGPVGGVDLGRSLRLWLSLQNSLNGLFDNTTAEGTAAAGQVTLCLVTSLNGNGSQ